MLMHFDRAAQLGEHLAPRAGEPPGAARLGVALQQAPHVLRVVDSRSGCVRRATCAATASWSEGILTAALLSAGVVIKELTHAYSVAIYRNRAPAGGQRLMPYQPLICLRTDADSCHALRWRAAGRGRGARPLDKLLPSIEAGLAGLNK